MPTIEALAKGHLWMPGDVTQKIEAFAHFFLNALADFHWDEARRSTDVIATLTQLVTTDFISGFPNESDYTGPVARLIADGLLPRYVDPENSRVKEIIEKCREKLLAGTGPRRF